MYDLLEHRHRFSVWAAARPAQRGLPATVDILRKAIEQCGVRREFVTASGTAPISEATFEEHHRNWCNQIVRFLKNDVVPDMTYGRAAKLIAVYLKSMVVLGPICDSDLARVAHPPIDRILLYNLPSSEKVNRWRTTTWTTLTEDAYYELISDLKKSFVGDGQAFWALERYWTVTEE